MMYHKDSKTFLRRRVAMLLAVIMVIGMMPISAFASDVMTKKVVKIATDSLNTEMSVPYGTSKSSLDLPAKLQMEVQTEAQDQTVTTTEESVKVNWEGSYDPMKAGTYKLQAAFAEDGYTYDNQMPTVSVKVAEQIKESTPVKKAASLSAAKKAAPVARANGEINLIDINAITSQLFEVKPSGSDNFIEVGKLPDDATVNVGDEFHIKFQYKKLENVAANNVYYFNIPTGLDPAEGSEGDVKTGDKVIGKWWVEDGKVKIQFTNESFLDSTDGVVENG